MKFRVILPPRSFKPQLTLQPQVEGEQLDISLLTLSIFLSGIQPRSQPKPARRDLLGTMRPRLMPRPRGGGRHEHGPPLASGPGGD